VWCFCKERGGGLFFPTPLLLSIILSLFRKYTFSSYASRSTCRDTKRQPRLKRFFLKKGRVFYYLGKRLVSLYNDEEGCIDVHFNFIEFE